MGVELRSLVSGNSRIALSLSWCRASSIRFHFPVEGICAARFANARSWGLGTISGNDRRRYGAASTFTARSCRRMLDSRECRASLLRRALVLPESVVRRDPCLLALIVLFLLRKTLTFYDWPGTSTRSRMGSSGGCSSGSSWMSCGWSSCLPINSPVRVFIYVGNSSASLG